MDYKNYIQGLIVLNEYNNTEIARLTIDKYGQIKAVEALRKQVSKLRKEIEENPELIDNIQAPKVYNSRVLVIGDTHEPFCQEGYLEFCQRTYKKYDLNQVVFIGDLIDNHYSSYHEVDPNGMSAGDEVTYAKSKIKEWYKAFPDAVVTLGNHDKLIERKAFSSGVSKLWIKDYKDVLETPNWEFVEDVVIDKVRYVHGSRGKADRIALHTGMCTVQGHYHESMGITYLDNNLWGMQTGTGINEEQYAFAYRKGNAKPVLKGCGVVIDGMPHIEPFVKQ